MNLTEVLDTAPDNQLIRNTFIKANKLLNSYKNPVCSISGGSDSDIMLDLLEKIRGDRKIIYVFFDTGIEYAATKKHLDELERKYGIKIIREKAKIPVPTGCKKYGVPLVSKEISQRISELQHNGFGWENEPYESLVQKYPNCISGLKWWCGLKGKYSISKIFKEFMSLNPPIFNISQKCCNGAKKQVAKSFYKQHDCMLTIIGERRAEGGMRASAHSSCFTIPSSGIPHYRPLYFWTDEDKKEYKEYYGITYSDCYEVYGMTRTGCAGCPFNSKFEDTLKIIHEYEPQLEVAVNNIFGESYEYIRAYKQFKEDRKNKSKTKEGK